MLIDEDGSGYACTLFMTINSADSTGRYNSRFQLFVDGEVTPSVDVPLSALCCTLGAGGAFNNVNQFADRFGSSETAFNIGSSFWFRFVAPYRTHIKAQIVNASAANSIVLGGYLQGFSGIFEWRRYGKLHASMLGPSVVAPYAEQEWLNVAYPLGGLFAGIYLHVIGGDGNYNYCEGYVDCYVDGVVQRFDSLEDFFLSGWYFWANKFLTSTVGTTYKDNAATIGTYRWFDSDPLPFDASFRMVWKNGDAFAVVNPSTVRAVLWWYEALPEAVVY